MGNSGLSIGIFAAFIVVTLVVVVRGSSASRSDSGFFAADNAFSGRQNGVALAGDYLSAAAFLGVTGAIAVYGYDGFLYSIGFLVAWLLALLLVAELLRNTGRFTMADVLSFRMRQRPVRLAAALSTLAVSFLYLLAQMNGAGGLVALLLGVTGQVGQAVVVSVVGVLMIVYVLIGGMRGTTWVQIIKAFLLITTGVVMAVWILGRYGFDLSALLGDVVAAPGSGGDAMLAPGKQYGATGLSRFDFVSLGITLVLGTAGLPHVLMRFYTVPDSRAARRSVVWAIGLIGTFLLVTLVLGYAAAAMVGPQRILEAPGKVNSAVPLLAAQLGGPVLLGIVAAVAFATILAVVAGLTITAAASFAHDIYRNVIKRGPSRSGDSTLVVARWAILVIGVVAIAGGIATNGQNVAFLVSLAYAVAGAANLPTILYSLFWKRFTTRGALWSIYGGLSTTLLLIVFSPVVSGSPTSVLPNADFAWFPLSNPGIVTIPLSFLLGYLGTVSSRERADADKFAEMEVRALAGVGIGDLATQEGRR